MNINWSGFTRFEIPPLTEEEYYKWLVIKGKEVSGPQKA